MLALLFLWFQQHLLQQGCQKKRCHIEMLAIVCRIQQLDSAFGDRWRDGEAITRPLLVDIYLRPGPGCCCQGRLSPDVVLGPRRATAGKTRRTFGLAMERLPCPPSQGGVLASAHKRAGPSTKIVILGRALPDTISSNALLREEPPVAQRCLYTVSVRYNTRTPWSAQAQCPW
jgi:hypothetical protein